MSARALNLAQIQSADGTVSPPTARQLSQRIRRQQEHGVQEPQAAGQEDMDRQEYHVQQQDDEQAPAGMFEALLCGYMSLIMPKVLLFSLLRESLMLSLCHNMTLDL